MDMSALWAQLHILFRDYPYAVYAAAGLLVLFAIFKRRHFFKLLLFLLFIAVVYLVVNQFGQSLETGIKNTELMNTKTRKAID